MRIKATFTLDKNVIDALKSVSRLTDIPQSRILERAIKMYMEAQNESGQS